MVEAGAGAARFEGFEAEDAAAERLPLTWAVAGVGFPLGGAGLAARPVAAGALLAALLPAGRWELPDTWAEAGAGVAPLRCDGAAEAAEEVSLLAAALDCCEYRGGAVPRSPRRADTAACAGVSASVSSVWGGGGGP